jgi:hypothetical protein
MNRVWLLLAFALSACGGGASPILQLNQTEKQLSRAQALNAEDTPKAALYLKLARDLVEAAKARMRDEDYDRARHQLRRAEADAELAEALALEAQASSEALSARKRLEQLKRDGTVE